MNKIKYCKFCDKEKQEEDFCKSGGYIKNICRDCQNKKQKQMYQDSKKTKQLEQEIERQKEVINRMIDNEEKYCLEINRLNNIINKLEYWLETTISIHKQKGSEMLTIICSDVLNKIKELKGSEKNE